MYRKCGHFKRVLPDNGIAEASHHKGMKFLRNISLSVLLLTTAGLFASTGCGGIVKQENSTPRLLKTEMATQAELMDEVNRFAKVNSLRAKMYLKFEDNSFAEFGNKAFKTGYNHEMYL